MTSGRRRQALGRYGEEVAARHLSAQGMVVLDRNWRCDLGEVDLVLRDGGAVVVCEVKCRSGLEFGDPLEGVSQAKADRLRLLAARWVEEHGLRPDDLRIDLVGVLRRDGQADAVEHVAGVC